MFADNVNTTYTYRPDGLRHSKETFDYNAVQNTVHLWDGQNICAEQNTSGVFARYLRGVNLIARQQDNLLQYYHFNAHGDVVQRTDHYGGVLKSYDYDAFGVEKNLEPMDANPWRYCGEYFDRETKTIYLRARVYSPSLGRFGSEDSAQDGLNWYTYCGNNPGKFVDPLGLAYIGVTISGVGFIPSNQYKIASTIAKNSPSTVASQAASAAVKSAATSSSNNVKKVASSATSSGFTVSVGLSGNVTLGKGISDGYSISVDSKNNWGIQRTYTNKNNTHLGLADVGITGTALFTNKDTIYDLEKETAIVGGSGGALGYGGIDFIAVGDDIMQKRLDVPINGIQFSAGKGFGADVHVMVPTTETLTLFNEGKWAYSSFEEFMTSLQEFVR